MPMGKPRRIRFESDPDASGWTAVDEDIGVASQGETRAEAIENLDAAALHEREVEESIDSWEAERGVRLDFGIDPDEVQRTRVRNADAPEWME
jgi:predicted RNase H-like HicB family nuclease